MKKNNSEKKITLRDIDGLVKKIELFKKKEFLRNNDKKKILNIEGELISIANSKYFSGTSLQEKFIRTNHKKGLYGVQFYILSNQKKGEVEKELIYYRNRFRDYLKECQKWLEKIKKELIEHRIGEISDIQFAEYLINLGNETVILRASGSVI